MLTFRILRIPFAAVRKGLSGPGKKGKGSVKDWLKVVEKTLSKEGFKPTWIQLAKHGQVFGLVKDLGRKWQMHVRGYKNGWLEAEIEVSRHYVQHHVSRYRRNGIRELVTILEENRVPFRITGTLPEADEAYLEPGRLTSWRLLAGWAGLAAFVVVLGCSLNRALVAIKRFLNRELPEPDEPWSVICAPAPAETLTGELSLGQP